MSHFSPRQGRRDFDEACSIFDTTLPPPLPGRTRLPPCQPRVSVAARPSSVATFRRSFGATVIPFRRAQIAFRPTHEFQAKLQKFPALARSARPVLPPRDRTRAQRSERSPSYGGASRCRMRSVPRRLGSEPRYVFRHEQESIIDRIDQPALRARNRWSDHFPAHKLIPLAPLFAPRH